MALVSRNGKGRGNAIVSGSGEVETECLCSGKRLFFISSTARELYSGKRLRGTRAGRERKFHDRSACGVSREFIAPSLAGAGERGSPGEWVSARPDWGKVGAGKTKYSGIVKCCRNAFGYWKWVRLQLRGYTRGDCFSKNDWIAPARVGNEEFLQAWRAGQDKRDSKRGTRASRETEESLCRASNPGKTDVKNCGILCFVQDVPIPGRSGLTWWSLQNRGSSRPRSRAKRGGRAPEAPKGGRRVSRRGDTTRPLTQNLREGMRTSPKSFPAERVLPAPRAGERTLFAFLQWLRPLRPAPGTVRNPASRGCDSLRYHNTTIARHACRNSSFPTRAGAAQSFYTMQSPRVARNKRHSLSATQTFRFNLPAFAFVGVSANVRVPRDNLSPAPASKSRGGQRVFP